MNYQHHYDTLINRARNRNLIFNKETHHIIPRCRGGTDEDSNLVNLTPEEHFVAHQLLVKIYPNDRKLLNGLSKMCSWSYKNPRGNKRYGWIRRKWAEANSGEGNYSSKFTNQQVEEIYRSTESLDILADRFNCTRYNIITIKRKIYYRCVTKDIDELPGYCEEDTGKGKEIPIPIDLIEKIFYDTGDYEYFWNTYRATYNVVRSIKLKRTWKKITSKLGQPGEVKRYNLTNSNIDTIINSGRTLDDLANEFGVHRETIRNIRKGTTRSDMWEDF